MEKLELNYLNIERIDTDIIDREFSKELQQKTVLTQMSDNIDVQLTIVFTSVAPTHFINTTDLRTRNKRLKITIEEVDL